MAEVKGELLDSEFQKSEVIMKLEFSDEDEKEDWMKTINAEINQLKCLAIDLSHQLA